MEYFSEDIQFVYDDNLYVNNSNLLAFIYENKYNSIFDSFIINKGNLTISNSVIKNCISYYFIYNENI